MVRRARPVDRGGSTGTLRWVKVFGAIALALILLAVLHRVVMGGHMSGGHGEHASPSGITEHGLRRP